MKLSIITINYNNKEGLKRTIKSVLQQTFKDFEWIVIDGGSADGSKALIEQNSEHFVYWVSEMDNGIYQAMNKGIKKAQGDWVLCLNSGDWLYESCTLEKVFANDFEGYDVVYGNMTAIGENGQRILLYEKPISLYYFYNNQICQQAAFFRRELYLEAMYDESYKIAADWAYCIDLVLRGKIFYHIDQMVCFFDDNGVSSTVSEQKTFEINRVKNEHFPFHTKADMERLNEEDLLEFRLSKHRSVDWIYRNMMTLCQWAAQKLERK